MIKSKYLFIAFVVFNLLACNENKTATDEDIYNSIVANSVDRDLEAIKKDGVLRALVVYSSTSYFLYKGQAMGFEYELLQWLAKDLNLKLEIIVSDNLDAEFEVLNRGDVDLIAHGMTITNQRKWEVSFTDYLYLTKQVLVQKKPDNFRKLSWKSLEKALVHDAVALINDTVSIRKNSAYYERILSLSNEIGGTIYIDTLDSQLSTGEIMDMVAHGELKYTIADENLAKINASSNPILDVKVPVSLSQRIAWVTRKKSKNFKAVLNSWILKHRNTKKYRVIYNKYFKNKRSFRRRDKSNFYSLKNNQISKYDDLIKTYAEKIGLDWRLLAAQVYQESRFDTTARSWAGATGLMQVMPATAQDLKINDLSDPEESLRGGTAYLKEMYGNFENISDSINRIKFAMAAFNCGYGHVADAQRLAEANDLNPLVWEEHVAPMLLELRFRKNYSKPFIKYGYVRGTEPVNYIKQIFDRYEQYKQFIEL